MNTNRNFFEELKSANMVEVETSTKYYSTGEFGAEDTYFWAYDDSEGEFVLDFDENTSMTPKGTSEWEYKSGNIVGTISLNKVLGVND